MSLIKIALNIIIILLIGFYPSVLLGQNQYSMVVDSTNIGNKYHVAEINSSNGLPQNEVLDLHLTSNNFLWICTQVGLSRYDGREVFNYTEIEEKIISKLYRPGFYKIDGKIRVFFDHAMSLRLEDNGFDIKEVPYFDKYYLMNKGNIIKRKNVPNYSFNGISITDSTSYSLDDTFTFSNMKEKNLVKGINMDGFTRDHFFMLKEKVFSFNAKGQLFEFIDSTAKMLGQFELLALQDNKPAVENQIIWKRRYAKPYFYKEGNLYEINLASDTLIFKLLAEDLPAYSYHSAQIGGALDLMFLGTTRNGLLKITKKLIKQLNTQDFCVDNFDHYTLAEIGEDSVITNRQVLFHNNKVNCDNLFPLDVDWKSLFHDTITGKLYRSQNN